MAANTAQIKELLTGANQLSTQDLGAFFQQVRELLSKRSVSALSQEEAKLLLRIQESAPLELLERAAILHEKRRNETLTEKEQEELILITGTIEKLHITRLELLTELAHRRSIPLRTLITQLGVVPFPSHG